MPTEGLVNFIYGSQASYDALETYNPNALYFLTDTNKLYKGDTLIANYVNERVIAAALVDLNRSINRLDSSLQDLGSVIIPAIQKPLEELKEIVDASLQDIYDSLNELDIVGAAAMADLDSRITDVSINVNEIGQSVYNIEQTLDSLDDYIDDAISDQLNGLDDVLSIINSSINSIEEFHEDLMPTLGNMFETINASLHELDTVGSAALIDLRRRIEDLSTNSLDSSALIDLSTNISELDEILAGVSNDLNGRVNELDIELEANQLLITEANTKIDDVQSRLNWIVVND